jgi:hypothetical protein
MIVDILMEFSTKRKHDIKITVYLISVYYFDRDEENKTRFSSPTLF